MGTYLDLHLNSKEDIEDAPVMKALWCCMPCLSVRVALAGAKRSGAFGSRRMVCCPFVHCVSVRCINGVSA